MKKTSLFLLIISILSISTFAQGWERVLGKASGGNYFRGIAQKANGDIVCVGWHTGSSTGYCALLSEQGNLKWEYYHSEASVNWQFHDIIISSEGGFLVNGRQNGKVGILRIDDDGETVSTFYSNSNLDYATKLIETSDKGIVIAGRKNNGGGVLDAYLLKLNSSGDSVWYSEFGNTNYQSALDLLDVGDGLVICGEDRSQDASYIVKVDYNGDLVWERYYMKNASYAKGVVEDAAGNLYVSGSTNDVYSNPFVLKLNSSGDSLQYFEFAKTSKAVDNEDLVLNDDGTLTLLNNYNNSSSIELWTINSSGTVIDSAYYGGASSDYGKAFIKNSSGGFSIAGNTYSFGYTGGNSYLIHTDLSGNSFANTISGYIYNDDNMNCARDPGEVGLSKWGSQQWMVKVTPGPFGQDEYYVSTDDSGRYSFNCETKSYVITPVPITNWVDPCNKDEIIVDLSAAQEVSENNNFGFVPQSGCEAIPVVDISASRMRVCREAMFYVNYCNDGFLDAQNVSIEVNLDPEFSFDSASISYTVNSDGNYVFDIGTINEGDCGRFNIYGTLNCNAEFGEAICAKANIYPQVTCEDTSATWDRSSMVVEGMCNGDSTICFTITNAGEDMAGTGYWRLYINDSLSTNGQYQLNSGEVEELCFLADGRTYRLETDQPAGHPGNSHPQAIVELCGSGDPITGYVLTVPQDDSDDWVEIECMEVTASYDPNDKQVQPRGVTSNKYIYNDDQLEYTIRFQNTGNDTAFTVRVIDTLDLNTINIESLKMMGASHNYDLNVFLGGVVEWVFNDIMLPDSGTDYLGSQGFVKFKINQVGNLSSGTKILNDGGIYFDYNDPVITNEEYNEIWASVLKTDQVNVMSVKDINDKNIKTKVWPNPVSSKINIQLNHSGFYSVSVVDLTGKVVKAGKFDGEQFQIDLSDMDKGVYMYQIEIEENRQLISGGILVKQ